MSNLICVFRSKMPRKPEPPSPGGVRSHLAYVSKLWRRNYLSILSRLLRAEDGRRQGLGPEATRPDREPKIPSQRKAKAGPDRSENEQAPRLAILPDEDGALLDRPVSGLDNPPAGRHLLVVPVQHPDPGAPVQELPPMEKPAEDPLDGRPEGDKEAPRPHTGQGPYQHRGAARRRAVQSGDSSFTRLQTSVGRQAHRWPRTRRMRPARPRYGKRGIRRNGPGRGRRRNFLGRE